MSAPAKTTDCAGLRARAVRFGEGASLSAEAGAVAVIALARFPIYPVIRIGREAF